VKRISGTPDGEVSNFLYNNAFEGSELSVTTPFGDLMMPDDDSPLLLASAGIGCTPMIGMLNHLADTGAQRSVSVIHADRSIADHAHRAELSTLVEKIPAATLHRWYEDLGTHVPFGSVHEGRADLRDITVEPDTQAFLCGPMPFMLAMRASLLERDVPAQNIHYEVFGPDSWANT
jgi:nitric oxide dioxygenase